MSKIDFRNNKTVNFGFWWAACNENCSYVLWKYLSSTVKSTLSIGYYYFLLLNTPHHVTVPKANVSEADPISCMHIGQHVDWHLQLNKALTIAMMLILVYFAILKPNTICDSSTFNWYLDAPLDIPLFCCIVHILHNLNMCVCVLFIKCGSWFYIFSQWNSQLISPLYKMRSFEGNTCIFGMILCS